jgi:hypothetical protein
MKASEVVQRLLEAEYPVNEIEALAQEWFRLNAAKVRDEQYEVGFTIFVDALGEVRAGPLERGGEAEIGFADAEDGGDPVGSLHTHVDSFGEFSDYDIEQGQKMADELGHPYYMFVVGLADDGESMTMSQELFEPQ